MNLHAASWKEISRLLREARSSLGNDPGVRDSGPVSVGVLGGTLHEFEEFLDHNELELAWDALAAVAERVGAQSTCWRKLAQAAGLMQMQVKQEQALAKLPNSG